jgi:S-adenosylmethionine-diacylgycerolhomoserine-N-methlytransferase
MNALAQLKILYHLALSPIRGETHQERLDSFYRGQAEGYDDFRKQMLHGREEMFTRLPLREGDRWVDLGCGTGSNAEYLADKLPTFGEVVLVDLSESLIDIAKKRVGNKGWQNVRVVHADATTVEIQPESVDVVTFAYSLTMIPNWFSAIEHAMRLLKPGGVIGVVDFYVAKKYPTDGHARHGWSTRTFWPTWFAWDNVFPNPDHLPYLKSHFDVIEMSEQRGKLPWMPFIRAPYYYFIGRKPI